MNATATIQPQSTPVPTISRQEARALLRAAPRTTLICAIVSHARGKLHCRSYKLYSGGWRTSPRPFTGTVTAKMLRCYGEYAAHFAGKAAIDSLEDQAEFIRASIKRMEDMARYWKPALDERLRTIAKQIIGDLPAPARTAVRSV